jgi:hypothetical protein
MGETTTAAFLNIVASRRGHFQLESIIAGEGDWWQQRSRSRTTGG